jgi:hypothetical protein
MMRPEPASTIRAPGRRVVLAVNVYAASRRVTEMRK